MEVCISDHDGCAGRIASSFMSPAPITRRDSSREGVTGRIASSFMSPARITRRDSAAQQRVGPAGGLSVADVEPTLSRLLRHNHQFSNDHDTVADNTTRRPTSPTTPPHSIVRQPVDSSPTPKIG